MKTKLLGFGLTTLLFIFSINAQVGVGNTNPQAQLDISASNTSSPVSNDGILIPRMSVFPPTPGASRDGMLIFYTSTGADGKGFYYWNQTSTSWEKIASGGKNTLDEAYDENGAGNGRIITADNGALQINGNDGFEVTGTFNSGNTVSLTGAGTRMFFNPRKAAFRAGAINGNQWNNLNIGDYSFASGLNTTASGDYSVAMGRNSIASGDRSIAIGSGLNDGSLAATNALGARAIAIGGGAKANANFSTAIGTNSTASGNSSFALTLGGESFSYGEAVFGTFPTNYTPNNISNWDTNDRIFTIGNGRDGSTPIRSNALTIYKSGLMNINDAYNMPLTDGTNGQVMTTDGTGNVTFQNIIGDGTGTDNQNIQNLAFNSGTNVLTVGIENGTSQTINLSALDSGGDINQVNAGNGLTGGGATGTVTINAVGTNGITTNANDFRLGGTLIQNTAITQGVRSFDINLNSTGDFAIQDNGTDVFFVEDSGDIGFGISNPSHPLHLLESVANELEGIYVDKNDNSSSDSNGIYVIKSGSGTGRSHAIRTRNDGTGTGQKYGVFNTISTSASGNQYGTRNFMASASPSFLFGTFNNLDNSGTGNQYGVFNGMRGNSASNLYGVFNEFQNASTATEVTGTRNSFTSGTPGSSGIHGTYTTFSNTANGNYYGSRNVFNNSATGTGNKYGTYNQISASAGGTHYGTYNSVNVNDGWATYNLGKSYISQRLSIGETDNADGRIAILNNSGGSLPVHIQLTETTANDGARIQFANTVETTNEWTLFGRADNTLSESTFNFFHTTTGNVMEIKGDGQVEINGQLGLNLNNPTYAITLPNSAVIGTGRGRANAWTTYSDSRVKSNQKQLQNGLSLINLMTPKTYFHHDGNIEDGVLNLSENGEQTLGFIAQELYKILPEAVQKPEDETKILWSVDYNKVIPVAVKAIQELNIKVETLEAENLTLKQQLSKLQSLEARLVALENNTNGKSSINTTDTSEE